MWRWRTKFLDRETSRVITFEILKRICTEEKIILENNNFTFNDEIYRQISGTASTIFAPTYATLTMGYFEVHFNNIWDLKWGKEFQEFILEIWSRFLHDCQTPLHKNKVKPAEFETLNSVKKLFNSPCNSLTRKFLSYIFW